MLFENSKQIDSTVPAIWADHRWLTSPYEFLQSKMDLHGPTFFVKLPMMGNVLMTGDSTLIREIANNKNLIGGQGLKILRPILGSRSTIMIDGKEHWERKKIILSIFDKITPEQEEKLITMTERSIAQVSLNNSVKLYDLVQRILLGDIINFLFQGFNENELENVKKATFDFLHSFHSPLFIFFKPFQVNLGKYSPWGKFLKNRERLKFEIHILLQRNSKSSSNHLSRLIELGLKSEDLIEEIMALLLFGHDTTTSAFSWFAFNVLSRPHIYDQLTSELSDYNSIFEASQSPLLQSCIMESNRITPTVTQVIRIASNDTQVGKIKIKQGTRVFPNLYLSHHNPQNYEHPRNFMPERFINNCQLSYSHIPFGFGQRICSGKNLAEKQIQLMGAVLFRKKYFALSLSPKKYKPIRNNVIISPSHGVLVEKISHE